MIYPKIIVGFLLITSLYLVAWINSPWEQVLFVADSYLFIAIAIGTPITLHRLYRGIQIDKNNNKADYNIALTFLVFLVGIPAAIFSLGYVLTLALNVSLPPQIEHEYDGNIILKEKFEGRSTEYFFTLDQVDQFGFSVRFKVSPLKYNVYREREHYTHRVKRGGLGIDYWLSW